MRPKFFCLIGIVALWPLMSRAQEQGADKHDVYVVPFSHLDLYWACTQEECLSRGNYIISRAVQLAKQYPDFRFVIEAEVFVSDFADSHRGTPELEDFRRLVKEGRIEIAPLWAGIYQNLPRGEALVRNVIYGKRYARDNYGVNPKVALLTDIPGFTRQYPQILSKSGTPFMVMTRMGPRDSSLFHWKAPDGSSVLVWNTINGYGWGAGDGLHLNLDKDRLAAITRNIAAVQATTTGPIYLGFGTDLWAPTEDLNKNLKVLNQRLVSDHFQLATPNEFFRDASLTPKIPDLSGEIPSSWANLTTSLVPLWGPAMAATDTLINAEKFAAIDFALGYAPYPGQRFEVLWKDALKSLDHNNDGQGGEIGDERKLGYAQEVSLEAGQILRDSLRNIAERVESPFKRSVPIVVFNPLSWTRDDLVRSHVTLFGTVETDSIDDYKKGMRLVDEQGTSVPYQVEQYSDGSSRSVELVFIAHDVPSLGYKSYYLVPGDKADSFPKAATVRMQTDEEAKQSNSAMGLDILDSQYYRISIGRTTGRLEIFDKQLNQVITKDAEIFASEENGGDDQNIILSSGRTLINQIDRVEVEENNPVRTVLCVRGEVGGTPVIQRITVYKDLKRIDLENTMEWKPGRSMNIEQVFPVQQANVEIRNGVPFGTVSGTEIMTNAGPHWEDEVAPDIWKKWRQIQDWVFAGTTEWGFTLSADHQLIEVDPTYVRSDMLRGTRFTPMTTVLSDGKQALDARPAAGTYTFRYSLTSGNGNWAATKSWQAGMAFSAPLIAITSANPNSQKPLPAQQSFLSLNAENLVVSALKKADDDDSIVLRAFEIRGEHSAASVRFLGKDRSFLPANLLEENVSVTEQKTFSAAPYEISTVKIKTDKQ
jgi:alpha-mannosidase